ncbi:YbaN family protein [Aquisalimonas sp.]|uniref:YbaN family protein n=1 Tax=Aquisalimonas sp. TaxID=1872621 RepID=UPI0025BA85AF|nr:YbaN family protein [Aquisalimonas sp.]
MHTADQPAVCQGRVAVISRWLWRALGMTAVAIGALGTVVPLLPTTPFLLVAAWAFARGSERWRLWLLNHPRFGPAIRSWQTQRAIPRKVKWIGIASVIASLLIAIWMQLPPAALTLQVIALVCVSIFLLTRPDSR